jgi:hypothetical protein
VDLLYPEGETIPEDAPFLSGKAKDTILSEATV